MFGLFVIEAGSQPVAVLDRDGKPLVYETGTAAAEMAAMFGRGEHHANRWTELKCQPRRLSSDAWKARELGRFADGTYIALPWADLPALSTTADHFAHVSTDDGAKIAYTQDAAKGAGDIQTRIKPGKYLAQFYGDIFDAPTIARMAAEFSVQYGEALELLFADTQDAIEHVYTNGPSSCMSHPVSRFNSSIHPTRIYAAGDLAVAYMVRNGDITARALVWPAKRLYGRVYGDETRLCDLLETASYVSGDLKGARMLRIEEGKGFVMPYIDGHTSASDNGEHLILGGCGVCGSNQNGLSGSNPQCHVCDDEIDEDDCSSDDYGNYYCESCHSERFGYCERTDETCERDGMQEVITTAGGRTQFWGQNAVDVHATRCEGDRNYYCNSLIVTLADGTEWSRDYFDDNGFECEATGELYSDDDCVTLEDGTRWCRYHFESHGVTVNGCFYDKDDAPDAEADGIDAPDAPSKPYKASPYVKQVGQLEMALVVPVSPEGGPRWSLAPHDGGWLISRDGMPLAALTGYFDALERLAELKLIEACRDVSAQFEAA